MYNYQWWWIKIFNKHVQSGGRRYEHVLSFDNWRSLFQKQESSAYIFAANNMVNEDE